jgi:hypothetical protein
MVVRTSTKGTPAMAPGDLCGEGSPTPSLAADATAAHVPAKKGRPSARFGAVFSVAPMRRPPALRPSIVNLPAIGNNNQTQKGGKEGRGQEGEVA